MEDVLENIRKDRDKMTFKQFKAWCNNRAADGCWSMRTTMLCIGIITRIDEFHFWEREKVWKRFEKEVLEFVIVPIDNMMRDVYGHGDPLVKNNRK